MDVKVIKVVKAGGRIAGEDGIMSSLRGHLALLKNGEYSVLIKKKTTIRSVPQNKLYWMWMRLVSAETGNDTDDIHTFFKRRYLKHRSVCVFGETADILPSTTDLSTAEFADYLEKIKAFIADYGISLPSPGEQGFEEMIELYGR